MSDAFDTPVRRRIISKIEACIASVRDAADLEHGGLTGTARELLVTELLKGLVTSDVGIGTGKVVDSRGVLSTQMDVIIYARNVAPPILYNDDLGIYPVESCLYAMEVKSTLDAGELDKAIAAGRALGELKPTSSEDIVTLEKDERIVRRMVRFPGTGPLRVLLALDSDLTGTSKTELERYCERDEDTENPALDAFCVVGKGYWYRSESADDRWLKYCDASSDFAELRGFLAGIVNTIPKAILARGRCRFGTYFGDP